LLAVAPYVGIKHNAYRFFEELDRLAETNPEAVSQVLGETLKIYQPDTDFRGTLQSILSKLANSGLKLDAIKHAEVLRKIPSMFEFYRQISRKTQG
jgi:hypothetical protein